MGGKSTKVAADSDSDSDSDSDVGKARALAEATTLEAGRSGGGTV